MADRWVKRQARMKDLDESYADFGKRCRAAAPPGAVTDFEIAAEIYAAE
ncbi:hypothetical protein [Streptomyces venezuelae]